MNARALKAERVFRGLTQGNLAKALNVSVVSYSKKERGEVRFRPEEIMVVADVLKLDQDKVNAIFFDGKLPKGNLSGNEFPIGNSASNEAPCT